MRGEAASAGADLFAVGGAVARGGAVDAHGLLRAEVPSALAAARFTRRTRGVGSAAFGLLVALAALRRAVAAAAGGLAKNPSAHGAGNLGKDDAAFGVVEFAVLGVPRFVVGAFLGGAGVASGLLAALAASGRAIALVGGAPECPAARAQRAFGGGATDDRVCHKAGRRL